ncbi:hypothetical protein GGR56DRAFT_608831 [Xylariaceae sp. FL0804]|nr:hypothetical protein GGR56DRAFT_608831 [Xylariaceae sp. FL0804]
MASLLGRAAIPQPTPFEPSPPMSESASGSASSSGLSPPLSCHAYRPGPAGLMGSLAHVDGHLTGRPGGALEGQAARACEKCRASKRKCDKKLPYCDRCVRLNAKCHYIQDPIATNPGAHGAQFVLFQSPSLATDLLLRGPEPLEGLSALQILSVISFDVTDGEPHLDWQYAISLFFHCIHSWYAVVHPAFFSRQLADLSASLDSSSPADSNLSPRTNGNGSGNGNVNGHVEQQAVVQRTASPSPSGSDGHAKEVALLVVAMFLTTRMRLTDAGEQYMFDDVYRFTKRLWALLIVGHAGGPPPSIELVQCGALIALYEYGHGEVESAYRTLSQNAPIARILGIQPGQLGTDGGVDELMSSMEEEQSCCLWWGMFILEQSIHQDEVTRQLPFIFEGPGQRTLLPDTPPLTPLSGPVGNILLKLPQNPPPPTVARHLSTNVHVGLHKLGTFQLSAKVSSLFHRALLLDQERRARPGEMPLLHTYRDLDGEVRQASQAMLNDSPVDWELTLDCFAMLISTLFVLYIPYLPILEHTSPQAIEADVELSTAVAALRFGCQMSTDISCKLNSDYESSPRAPSILCAPAGATCYLVIFAFDVFGRIFPDEHVHFQEGIRHKFESLWLFSFRWGIAERMMRQLEQRAGLDRRHYLKRTTLIPPALHSVYAIAQ